MIATRSDSWKVNIGQRGDGDNERLTSPHLPRPGIQASMSYFRYADAPNSSVGISSTLLLLSAYALEFPHHKGRTKPQ